MFRCRHYSRVEELDDLSIHAINPLYMLQS